MELTWEINYLGSNEIKFFSFSFPGELQKRSYQICFVWCFSLSRIKTCSMVVCCGFGVSSKQLGQLMFWVQKRRRRVHCVCAPIWPSTTRMAKRATLWNLDRSKIWEVGTSNKRPEPHLERVVSINEWCIHDHFFLSKFLTVTYKPARNRNSNTTTFDIFFFYFLFTVISARLSNRQQVSVSTWNRRPK